MSDWFKVEFHGKPPAGKEPNVPATSEEARALATPLFEAFGFEFIDNVRITKVEPGPLVQCKVTAATVNYPCGDPCDEACAPGSTATPTLKGEWGPALSLPARRQA